MEAYLQLPIQLYFNIVQKRQVELSANNVLLALLEEESSAVVCPTNAPEEIGRNVIGIVVRGSNCHCSPVMVLWVMGTDSSEPSLIVNGIYVCAWELMSGGIEDKAADCGCAEREDWEELHHLMTAVQTVSRDVSPIRKIERALFI